MDKGNENGELKLANGWLRIDRSMETRSKSEKRFLPTEQKPFRWGLFCLDSGGKLNFYFLFLSLSWISSFHSFTHSFLLMAERSYNSSFVTSEKECRTVCSNYWQSSLENELSVSLRRIVFWRISVICSHTKWQTFVQQLKWHFARSFAGMEVTKMKWKQRQTDQ